MNLHNINTIAGYEGKLLKRSWLFRIFAFLALFGISVITLWYFTPLLDRLGTIWPREAVSSQIPFFNTRLYSMAQSMIAVFLAGNFLQRDKKLDTAEVIYVRPMSNADYIVGKTWGIIRVFAMLNVISLMITAFLHLALTSSPFSVFPYVFYLLTISIPSLIFVLGLSFTMMCLLKNQAVTFVVMLGIIGVSFFYVKDACFGAFDFFGVYIPVIFSDVTGHAHLGLFLLQRFIYLMAGAGFLCFTIALVKRLPHKPWKTAIVHALGGMFLLIALAAGGLYIYHYHHGLQTRNEYIAVFNRYAGERHANIPTHVLTVTPGSRQLEGESRMKVENRHADALEHIILYLNPALQVTEVRYNGGTIHFHREHQAILIEKELPAKGKAEITIRYRGGIDERICYADVPEKEWLDNTTPQKLDPLGKHYMWLEEKFTLLTPECLWYPVSIPPVHPAAPYNLQKDFTHYALTVNYDGEKTVLSQGESERQNGKTIFTNRTPLPCISLTIADYERKALTVDSTEYEILYFKGHDFFSSTFQALRDTLPGFLREFKNDIEREQRRDYPFRKFVMAETPIQHHAYVRNWKGYTEYVMPGILFFPERGVLMNFDLGASKRRSQRMGGRRGEESMDEEEALRMSLHHLLSSTLGSAHVTYGWNWRNQLVNKFCITPMLYHHTGFVRSQDYPIANLVLNMMQGLGEEKGFSVWNSVMTNEQKAKFYLQKHSFEDAMSDAGLKPEIFHQMLELKSLELKNYILTRVKAEDFNRFAEEFFLRHAFNIISFDTFKEAMETRFSIRLDEFLSRWYKGSGAPTVYIKNVDANQVLIDEVTKYKIHFKMYNPTQTDAFITTDIVAGGGQRGGPRGGGIMFFAVSAIHAPGYYLLPAGEAREVKIVCDEAPSSIRINTNISNNLPSLYSFPFSKVDKEIRDTATGIFPISPAVFREKGKEIIVDNEDKGFQIIESNSRHKLKDFFQKEEEEKYGDFMPWRLPSKWKAFAANFCYGEIVKSAYMKRKGAGNNAVVWNADIPKDGYYEVAIWNPKEDGPWGSRRHGREREEHNQTYSIRYGNETEEITLDMQNEEPGWVSLGNFYLRQGSASVTLTDKISGNYDWVLADAVKFTPVD